jgi:hypothetical protein
MLIGPFLDTFKIDGVWQFRGGFVGRLAKSRSQQYVDYILPAVGHDNLLVTKRNGCSQRA